MYVRGMDALLSMATLTGLAVGDALGMPFETQHYLSDAILNWDGNSFQASAFHNLSPGQWTDDTQMSLCLTESLLEWKRYNPRDIAQRYLAWYQSGQHRGMGNTTRQAIQRLEQGYPSSQSGVLGAEGNAPAMRAAPIGLFYRNRLSTLQVVAWEEAQITHKSEAAQDGETAVALGVALLARGTPKAELLDDLLDTMRHGAVRRRLAETLKLVKEQSYLRTDRVPFYVAENFDVGARIIDTVASSFFILAVTSDYGTAVQTAIRAGGDTDTRAAIVGGLAGTVYGFEQVQPYLAQVEYSETLRRLELQLILEAPDA